MIADVWNVIPGSPGARKSLQLLHRGRGYRVWFVAATMIRNAAAISSTADPESAERPLWSTRQGRTLNMPLTKKARRSMSMPPPPSIPPAPPASPPPPPSGLNQPGSSTTPYPARLVIDYPDQLNRLTTAFRIVLIIPIAIVLSVLSNSGTDTVQNADGNWVTTTGTSITGALFFATLLMVLFRRRYPKWWFDFALELSRFSARVSAYFALLTDTYPSTVDEQSVHLDIDYPADVERDLDRWLPLVKWFLAIPHFIVLFFLGIGAFFAIVIAWFAIVFTGRYPRGLFDYVVGVGRWSLRVYAYAFLLVTDRYPPFELR